jgi:K+-transporting ATPase KdpF subunit
MTAWYIFGALLSLGLAAYLIVALINAEELE